MRDYSALKEALQGNVYTVDIHETKEKRLKEKIGTSETVTVNQLYAVQSVTVFGDLFISISELALEKNINLYVYRRDKGEHHKHRTYWGIYAVKAGNAKTVHPSELSDVLASIDEYPHQVNHRRSSKQYKLLKAFLQALSQV